MRIGHLLCYGCWSDAADAAVDGDGDAADAVDADAADTDAWSDANAFFLCLMLPPYWILNGFYAEASINVQRTFWNVGYSTTH